MVKVYPYSDIFVRYLLGNEKNKDLLLSFINAVNEDSDFPLITDLTIKNPYNLKEFENDKETILDVKVKDPDGNWYNVEIQVAGNETYIWHSMFYWAQVYSDQIKESEKYQILKPVICINLLNFTLFDSYKDCHSCFMPTERNHPNVILSDHFVIHFPELPKFFEQNKFDTNLKNWLAYFKYEGKEEKIMEIVLKNNPTLNKAHKEYKKFTKDEKLMDIYQARLRRQLQYASDLKYSEDKGIEKGIKQGVKQGVKQGIEKGIKQGVEKGIKKGIEKGVKQQEIISNMQHTEKMLAEKISWDIITKITNVTEKQYLEWKKSNK